MKLPVRRRRRHGALPLENDGTNGYRRQDVVTQGAQIAVRLELRGTLVVQRHLAPAAMQTRNAVIRFNT